MALEKTEAVLLKAFNWSESSRTVVFFSRVFGKITLIDKAGRSFKTRRGRLLPFSRMEITFYGSQKETRGYISEVELLESFLMENNDTLGRLTFASAACELLNTLLPEEEPFEELYLYYLRFLKFTQLVEKEFLASIFLSFFLRLLSGMGYNPSLSFCVSCRKEANGIIDRSAPVFFSPERGGIVCSACQKAGEYYIPFSIEDYRQLLALQTASLKEAAAMTIGYQKTVLFTEALYKFVSYQAGLSKSFKSLEFLEKMKNSESVK